MAMMRGFG